MNKDQIKNAMTDAMKMASEIWQKNVNGFTNDAVQFEIIGKMAIAMFPEILKAEQQTPQDNP